MLQSYAYWSYSEEGNGQPSSPTLPAACMETPSIMAVQGKPGCLGYRAVVKKVLDKPTAPLSQWRMPHRQHSLPQDRLPGSLCISPPSQPTACTAQQPHLPPTCRILFCHVCSLSRPAPSWLQWQGKQGGGMAAQEKSTDHILILGGCI